MYNRIRSRTVEVPGGVVTLGAWVATVEIDKKLLQSYYKYINTDVKRFLSKKRLVEQYHPIVLQDESAC